MTIKIEALGHLVDATDTELNSVKGGYAALVTKDTNADKGAKAFRLVLNQRVSLGLSARQLALGIPPTTIALGVIAANVQGRGVYTPAVAFGKLED
jgi:hypothetical protein